MLFCTIRMEGVEGFFGSRFLGDGIGSDGRGIWSSRYVRFWSGVAFSGAMIPGPRWKAADRRSGLIGSGKARNRRNKPQDMSSCVWVGIVVARGENCRSLTVHQVSLGDHRPRLPTDTPQLEYISIRIWYSDAMIQVQQQPLTRSVPCSPAKATPGLPPKT